MAIMKSVLLFDWKLLEAQASRLTTYYVNP